MDRAMPEGGPATGTDDWDRGVAAASIAGREDATGRVDPFELCNSSLLSIVGMHLMGLNTSGLNTARKLASKLRFFPSNFLKLSHAL